MSVNHESQEISEDLAMVNERFELFNFVASTLVKELRRPQDVNLIRKMLESVQEYFSNDDIEVKKHILVFFKFMLKILRWTTDNQPLQVYSCWYTQDCHKQLKGMGVDNTVSKAWTEENKSYLATKTLPNGMIIFYIAVAEGNNSGWQRRGLEAASKREFNEHIDAAASETTLT